MEIKPGKSVGQIQIGMSRADYESLLGPSVDVFKRTPDAAEQIVAYDSKHLHLTLGTDGKIKSVTVFRPEKVELEKVQLLGRGRKEVETDLKQGGFEFVSVDAGLWSPRVRVLLVDVDGIIDGVEVLAGHSESEIQS